MSTVVDKLRAACMALMSKLKVATVENLKLGTIFVSMQRVLDLAGHALEEGSDQEGAGAGASITKSSKRRAAIAALAEAKYQCVFYRITVDSCCPSDQVRRDAMAREES